MSRPDPKASKPPTLAPKAATPTEISAQAVAAGTEEGKRLRRRTGRRATRLTTPGFMVPATIERRQLSTTLG